MINTKKKKIQNRAYREREGRGGVGRGEGKQRALRVVGVGGGETKKCGVRGGGEGVE